MKQELSVTHINRTIDYLPTLINIMRMVVGLAVLVFYIFVSRSPNSLIHFEPHLFYIWLGIDTIFIIAMLIFPQRQISDANLPSPINLIDLIMMIALMHIAGGVETGFGILVLPFVATACVSHGGKNKLTYASFATVLLMTSTLLTKRQEDTLFIQTGLLSGACFLIAFLSSYASSSIRRAIQSAQLNEERLELFNKLNHSVLEQVQEGVIVVNQENRIVLFNQQAKKFFPDLVIDTLCEELSGTFKHWQKHGNQIFDDKSTSENEEIYIHAQPLYEHGSSLLLISLRSAGEIAQESQAHKLASLGQLTANLAHEIRNPLSAIGHANELLMESNHDDVEAHLKGIIQHNVDRINVMIQEILSLNRRDRMNRQLVHLTPYLKNFLTEFMLSNRDTVGCIKIGINTAIDYTIFFDEGHLHQILNNLLNNAWKYSKKDQNAIQIRIEPYSENEIVISVHDNGPGVTLGNEEKIFEPFFTTSNEGTGLGLYVAKELAQANKAWLTYNTKTKSFDLVMELVVIL